MKTMFSLAVLLSLLLLSCSEEITVSQSPFVRSFSPVAGKAGDTVIVNGFNFSVQAAGNTVKFNNTVATVINASFTKITVIVPADATTGKISVTVFGKTGTSTDDFTVGGVAIPTVHITAFSPATGAAGDEVTITGSGFSTDMGQNTVKFANNVTATVTAATATELKVTVPAGAITGAISVTVGTQSATSSAVFEMLKDIPRNGLVAFYPLTGNGNDASGNGNHLTENGTTTLTTDRFGGANHAYSFVGGNSRINNSNNSVAQVSNPLTVALWVKYDSLIGSSFVSKYYPNDGFILSGNWEGKITCTIDGPTSVISNSVHLPMNTNGQWIFIGITYDGVSFRIYKNGALAETISKPGSITATTGNMRIGLDGYTDPASPHAFHCMIDDVTLYNRVLSDTEMQQLYDQTISK